MEHTITQLTERVERLEHELARMTELFTTRHSDHDAKLGVLRYTMNNNHNSTRDALEAVADWIESEKK